MAARWSDEPDDTESWMAWRNANLDQQPEADALGRALWNGATRSGDSVWEGQPSDLTALGLAALQRRIEPKSGGQVGGAPDSLAPAEPGVADGEIEPAPPGYKTVTARPGDSISRLMGTSRPEAIGRFVNLNGLRNSTLQAGQSYRVPTSYDDATPDDRGIGNRLLQSDNARLAALRAGSEGQAGGELFAQRLDAGRNVWTGDVPGKSPAADASRKPPENPDPWALAGKDAIAAGAYTVGAVFGGPRAAYHAVRDIKDIGQFGLDASGAFGPEAQARAIQGVRDKGHAVLQYGRAARRDPSRVASDVGDLSKAAIESVNPFDVPMSGTLGDVTAREFAKGMNLGEAATNIAAAIAAPELGFGAIKAANFGATKGARVAKLIGEGANPRLAEYLAEPYEGMGHHALIPRRFKVPESVMGIPVSERWVGNQLPGWVVDNPLNISIPLGMSREDFYKYHYGVDGYFHGAKLPADLNNGKGWSGKKSGARRYSPAGRGWAGVPVPLKSGVAAVGTGDAFGAPEAFDQETSQ